MKAKNYSLRCNSKTSLRKHERSQRHLWGDTFNQSPERRLRDLQISHLWDVSETLYETSQRCIWDASMPAGSFLFTLYPLLFTSYFLLVFCFYLHVTRYYFLVSFYSLFVAFYLLLVTFYWLLVTTYLLLFTLLFICHYLLVT